MAISQTALDELALTAYEYEQIVKRLGREPNELELGLFGALWSEHCGYMHTAKLIRTLPASSGRTLITAGTENAGVIDIGDGCAVAMKIESHNHPSAIDPVQGAATGVGGIVRDILAMGARPTALLNSLRFGEPTNKHQRFLLNGVVGGISNYGNCIGVPNIGGEVVFDDCYAGNPLVNAMCIGLIRDSKVLSARAKNVGDLLVLVGADTGRDGIHGASALASRTFEDADNREAKSAVQVGNPFFEKVLIELCLSAKYLAGVVGMQDCGAAGLTSAAIEMAKRSNFGLVIDVARVPCRSVGMTAYEIMLSESQERMLLAVEEGGLAEVQKLAEKWDMNANVIGHFEQGENVTIKSGADVLCSTPIDILTSPPEYELTERRAVKSAPLPKLETHSEPISAVLLKLLSSPNLISRAWVYSQYDQHVQNNTVIEPGGDAAVIRIQGTRKALAAATDGNGRFCQLNPRVGAQIAVAEACRNVAMTGAEPIALTDGLNFGDPNNPEVAEQLVQAVVGIGQAADAFGVPIVSGNASLYNESHGTAIQPTPIIGALGLLDDVANAISIGFKHTGDLVAVVGDTTAWDTEAGLAGSEYDWFFKRGLNGEIAIDLQVEKRLQAAFCELAQKRLLSSAHDCSLGGSAIALVRSAIAGGLGVNISEPLPKNTPVVAAFFGEKQSRAIVSFAPDNATQIQNVLEKHDLPYKLLGTVEGDSVKFADVVNVPLLELAKVWQVEL